MNLPHYELHAGDSALILATLPADSFHVLITDPPYGIDHLKQAWDDQIPPVDTWKEIIRVLKPGALGAVFGFPRTFHRLGTLLEEAGFEIRDLLFWLRADCMPKGEDLGKRLDRRRDDREATIRFTVWFRAQLKRLGLTCQQVDDLFGLSGMANHWTTTAKQPRVPTVDQWQTIRAAFPQLPDDLDDYIADFNRAKGLPNEAWWQRPKDPKKRDGFKTWSAHRGGSPLFNGNLARGGAAVTEAGRRFTGYNTQLRPAYEPIFLIQKPSPDPATWTALQHGTGTLHVANPDTRTPNDTWPPNLALDPLAADILDTAAGGPVSRFFYCPKSSTAERTFGADGLPHPSPKPLRLMSWLCQLLRPPAGGIVLDPFMGSGTTGAAALLADLEFYGVDLNPDHVEHARRRLASALELDHIAHGSADPALRSSLFGDLYQ